MIYSGYPAFVALAESWTVFQEIKGTDVLGKKLPIYFNESDLIFRNFQGLLSTRMMTQDQENFQPFNRLRFHENTSPTQALKNYKKISKIIKKYEFEMN